MHIARAVTPNGTVNPFAIEQIAETGYPLTRLRSKSWDEFADPEALQMDAIITVCDNAAGEVCPYWPGHLVSGHWGFEDPAAAAGTDEQKRDVFRRVFHQIKKRIARFVSLPLSAMDTKAIKREIDVIGNSEI